MAKRIIKGVLAFLITILIFLFFRLLYYNSWFSKITLSYELVPLDVINLLITSSLTIFLAWYITKKLTEQRYEKEFIIGDLKNIEEQINYIEKITSDSESINLQPLLDLLSKLQIQIERFNKTLDLLNLRCNESAKLNNYYVALYEKATNVDGIQLDIDSINRKEIHLVCLNLVLTTRSIICTINKN